MSYWENNAETNEWYTPKYIFDALNTRFDLDVCAPTDRTFVNTPTSSYIYADSLEMYWDGFVWMNPPFGGRNGLVPWLDKFFEHGNGIALTPDRSSAPWYQESLKKCDGVLLISGKVKFIKPDGKTGDSPSTGTSLFAIGERGITALRNAEKNGLGTLLVRYERLL